MTVGLLLGAMALVAVGVSGCEKQEVQPQTTDGDSGGSSESGRGGEILTGTTGNFDELVLQSRVPVLVDFGADWCPPCRQLHPELEQVARAYPATTLKVVQVDVDRNRALAQRYRISSIPALFVIKNGQTVDEAVGYRSAADLKRMVGRHL